MRIPKLAQVQLAPRADAVQRAASQICPQLILHGRGADDGAREEGGEPGLD